MLLAYHFKVDIRMPGFLICPFN